MRRDWKIAKDTDAPESPLHRSDEDLHAAAGSLTERASALWRSTPTNFFLGGGVMGGRGASWNTNASFGDNAPIPLYAAVRTGSEKRSEVVQLFKDIGFTDVTSMHGIPTQVLSSVAAQIQRISIKMGGVVGVQGGITRIGSFAPRSSHAALAYVQGNNLMINAAYFSHPRISRQARASMEKSGFKAGHYSGINAGIRATFIHELGHALHNKLIAQTDISVKELSTQIAARAIKKYHARKAVSEYGASNAHEFFAEGIATAYFASPRAYGMAVRDVLGL